MSRIKDKIICIVTAAALLASCLSFAACDGDKDSTSVNGGDSTSASVSDGGASSGGDLPGEEEGEKVDKSALAYVSALDGYKKTDWSAKWIWTNRSVKNSYVALRKSFTLDKKPTEAIASIAAESKYYLWINGSLAVFDGGYKRGPTMYDSYYQDVDLTEYLKAGENTLVALVCYNGRGGNSSVSPGQGGFLFEMDCGGNKIVSDETFKAQRLTAYKNDILLKDDYPDYDQFTALAEHNCYYDARDSVGDFTSPTFDDSAWDFATVVSKVGVQPFNDTYLCVAPPFAFDKTYTDIADAAQYLGKEFTTKTTIKISMGENRQFSPYFELTAKEAGADITYYTDTYITSNLGSFKDDYITKAGEQSYESYPWRSGQYLIIEVPAGVTFTKIAYRESAYASKQTGSFVSSDEKLNVLWQKAVNTLKICMRDTYMDCPERERSAYLGDATNQILQTFYCLDENSYAMTKKTVLTLAGWVTSGTGGKNDDVIPLRTPSITLNECPVQVLAFVSSVWSYYLYTGDAETVKIFYPIAQKYLKLYNLQADGLLEYRNGSFMWTDWGEGYDAQILENCFYYMALCSVYNMAQTFGYTNDYSFFTERMTSIRTNFRTVFLKEGGFTSGTAYDDRANAMAVVAGLAEKEDYPLVLNVLKTVEKASPYMEKYVLEALAMMGEYDECIARMERRFGDMIESEYTTLWEEWNAGAPSQGTPNHGWSGGALIVLSRYVAGVAPTAAGYEKYEITLQDVFSSLTSVTPTVKGNITLRISGSNGEKTVVISTVRADGVVKIPLSMGTDIEATGDATRVGVEDGYTVYKVTGGEYTFTVK